MRAIQVFLGFLLSLGFISRAADLDGGGWISGGGDPLRFHFAEGRSLALAMIQDFRIEDLSAQAPAVTEWIRVNRQRLYDDVSATPIEWNLVANQVTCALTEFRPAAPIRLSLEPCRRISSPEEAAKLLIHESTHHLGLRDEDQADQIAIGIAIAYEKTKLAKIPFCRTTEHDSILRRVVGTWLLDRGMTNRLGGAFRGFARASITLETDASVVGQFEGFGGCALQAGYLRIEGPARERSIPYVIASKNGALVMIHPRLAKHDVTEKGPLRVRYLTFTKAREEENDVLFLGDENTTEAHSAFSRRR